MERQTAEELARATKAEHADIVRARSDTYTMNDEALNEGFPSQSTIYRRMIWA